MIGSFISVLVEKSPHPALGHLLPSRKRGTGEGENLQRLKLLPSPVPSEAWEKVPDRADEGPF